MRLLISSLAALAALAIAAPSFAQEAPASSPPTAKTNAKSKPRTAAQCEALKTETSRTACLKRLHAQAPAKAPAPAKATPGKGKAKTAAQKKNEPAPARTDSSAEAPPAAPPSAPAPSQTGPIAIPPLPQKTI